ncbi:YmfQ family protein [Paraburkholderia sp. BR14263]|uniref:YmfQ family protein n=1 Tax=unclassified Paraburkholderia TaxID=2615204 RepID=UPI0034CF2E53
MRAPNYSAADYLRVLWAHLPRGRVWNRNPDSVQTKVLSGFTPVFERLTARASNLLVDAFPATTYELLAGWESTLGLPDPCAGDTPSLEQRQFQVVARLTNSGGQSIPFFIAHANALGYEAKVRQFTPFRVGQQHMGCSLGSDDWAHTWQLRAPAQTISYFCVSQSYVGQPLAAWGNAVLECEMEELKPAQTILNFTYDLPVRVAMSDGTLVVDEDGNYIYAR